jgi:hypothetical protein
LGYLKKILAGVLALAVTGCATQGPIDNAVTRVALTPEKDQVTVEARAHKPIGEIIPVDVALANGTPEPYRVNLDEIFGINAKGERIVAVPLGQAIELAGDATKLKTALRGAGVGAAVGGGVGAVLGTAVGLGLGLLVHEPGLGAAAGAIIGGGVGAGQGIAYGAMGASQKKDYRDNTEIQALALGNVTLKKQFTANGYVFLPTGQDYKFLELLMTNEESGEPITIQTVFHNEQGAVDR